MLDTVSITHWTYSLSLFVVFTSGSLPRRPMRISLETSEERAVVVENACDGGRQMSSSASIGCKHRLTREVLLEARERRAAANIIRGVVEDEVRAESQ